MQSTAAIRYDLQIYFCGHFGAGPVRDIEHSKYYRLSGADNHI